MIVNIPISIGELVDKITILEIKAMHIQDPKKRTFIEKELKLLNDIYQHLTHSPALNQAALNLKQINQELWDIEDNIRDCERKKDFGETFIQLARSVYVTNDQRAEITRTINQLTGSTLSEIKSYEEY